jgi:tRNA pseudouridine38-40 synthase
VEETLARMLRQPITLVGASRTDAGVHALGQVASFGAETRIPADGLRKGLNAELPRDVAVTAVREVTAETATSPGFSARRQAGGKRYRYLVWNGPDRAPLIARTSWHVRRPLEVAAMAEAGRALVGEHDFAAFRASDCDRLHTVRRLWRLDVTASAPPTGERGGPLIALVVEGDGFLKNMVRIIAGTLVEAGYGRRDRAALERALASKRREDAGLTAPAHGLCLEEVFYEPPLFERAQPAG